MSKKMAPSLGEYVQTFFGDYLTNQRNLSPNTVLSYRDAFKLFLTFAARHRGKHVVDLDFGDVGPDTVLAFLEDLQRTRRCSVRTRNARLAALHTFFRYVAAHEPQVLGLCQQVSNIPVKKTSRSTPVYLEYDEVLHVLDTIDRSTQLGRRDHLLVHILFETGARAEEVATMSASSFRLTPPCQVRIVGKGRKERSCPIRSSTARAIREYLHARGLTTDDDVPFFVGQRRYGLTRHGILRAVQRRVRAASATLPTLADKRVGAHTFRHTAAVHLLRSGNALPVIRSWLGHASVVTTDQYAHIDLEMKRRALEATEPPATTSAVTAWKEDASLLAWLEAL
jgi:integrase/recombinase XerD